MPNSIRKITPVTKPSQFEKPRPRIQLVEVDELVRASEARNKFNITGKGFTVAVLDTGLRTTHVDFEGRVINQKNYTLDNNTDLNDANDGNGHGTNVGGIIVANGIHKGIAPEANIIPIKVLRNDGAGSFLDVEKAMDWILQNYKNYNITVVSLSLGDSSNLTDDSIFNNGKIKEQIKELRNKRIATVIAAGNDYFKHNSQQGMGYPAIIRDCISVGAVYDARIGQAFYHSGAEAYSTGKDIITPFSQRLHKTTSSTNATTIFAPGAPVTSSGIINDSSESIQHGTSQAAPVVSGAIILIQELYKRYNNKMPTIAEIENLLQKGGITINDGDNEDDNVLHTGLDYKRLDIVESLNNISYYFYSNNKESKVKELQKFLNTFSKISLTVDGFPGNNTSEACKKIFGEYLNGDIRKF